MRSAEMTAASKCLLSRCLWSVGTSSNCFLDLCTTSAQSSCLQSFDHLTRRDFTTSLNFAFFVTRLPPRGGDHKMHRGKTKNSDQLTSSSSSSAFDKSLPHSAANDERWLFGTRFTKGVASLQISMSGMWSRGPLTNCAGAAGCAETGASNRGANVEVGGNSHLTSPGT